MTNRLTLRLALAASLFNFIALPALGQDAQKPEPASKMDLDAAPEGASPDPLAPPEVKGPAPLAPGAPVSPPQEASQPQDAKPEIDPVLAEVRTRLSQSSVSREDNREDVAGLTAFYEHSRQPVWTTKEGFNDRAQEAISEIRKAGNWGLDASAFKLPEAPTQLTPETLAETEIQLSLAVLKYARYARGGQVDPTTLTSLIDQKPHVYDPKSVLQAISVAKSADAYLRGLHPKQEQFERLRQALLTLNKAKADPTQIRIPSGSNLKPGDQDAQIALLRQRLGVAADAGKENLYDENLLAAVNSYQREHSLQVNGIVDRKMRASLNDGVGGAPEEKRDRIIANMERWRWMPENLGDFYVWDSIPEQLTRVFDHGKMVLMEKIVVGKPTTPTPVFSANMQFIIFHPEWGVPDSIKTNEIAPKLRRYSGGGGDGFFSFGGGGGGGQVLRSLDMRVSLNGREVDPDSVDWSSVDIKRFQFIQASSERNVLGVVKFRFPNKHDVYMHDTPDRQLFGKTTRAFSHGCMRTQNPVHLAEVLLGHDKGWSPEQVREIAAEGSGPNEIKLTNAIPVHVNYFTVDVQDDGKVRYLPDLYGTDNIIISALKGKPVHYYSPEASANEDTNANANQSRRYRPAGTEAEARDGWRYDRRPGDRYGRQRQWNPFEDDN